MTDRREQICARLVVIAQGIAGISQVARNQLDVTTKPAIVIWDGDESVDPAGFGRGRPATAPLLVDMNPEMRILASGPSSSLGTTINGLRILVVKAVLADSSLAAIVTPKGEIRYEGCNTELARGRAMQGELGLTFAFRYPLIQSEL